MAYGCTVSQQPNWDQDGCYPSERDRERGRGEGGGEGRRKEILKTKGTSPGENAWSPGGGTSELHGRRP